MRCSLEPPIESWPRHSCGNGQHDGNATLFIGDRQIYLTLGMTSLGQLRLVPVAGVHGWLNQVIRDWKLDTEVLPEIIGQLNRGQSIEVIDHDGLPLRLCVDPKERRNEVERLVKEPNPPAPKRDYHKIAAGQLEQVFGSELEPEAVDELSSSVVKQWQNYDGHASLFDDDSSSLSRLPRKSVASAKSLPAGRA